MGDVGDDFRAMKEDGKERRSNNLQNSPDILRANGIEFEELSETHLRVGAYDFWPSTGLFIERATKRRARGVFCLIRRIKEG